jgi:hypothetical protein
VRLTSERPRYARGEPLRLQYTVQNRASEARFVVTDPFLADAPSSVELDVLLGEAAVPRGLFYFDYDVPLLRRLQPGAAARRRLTISLPLQQTGIDADGNVRDVDVEVSGAVTISLRVGFLRARFRPHSADPWGEFLTAQEISLPARTRVRIDPAA